MRQTGGYRRTSGSTDRSAGRTGICGRDSEPDEDTHKTVMEGHFTTITNVNFDNQAISAQIEKTEMKLKN
jgi:hydroxylamine reductase (hybrid-cluster protein)